MRMNITFKAGHVLSAFLVVFLFAGLVPAWGQTFFEGRSPEGYSLPLLEGIDHYDAFRFDLDSVYRFVHSTGQDIHIGLRFGEIAVSAVLDPKPVRRADAVSWAMEETGLKQRPPRPNIIFMGWLDSDPAASILLGVNKGFLAGSFQHEGILYSVEPLWHHVKSAPRDIVVIYDVAKAKVPGNPLCGTDENIHRCTDPGHQHDAGDQEEQKEDGEPRSSSCKLVEYGAALDWLFVNEYGGEAEAWDRVDYIMGTLVQGQYTGHFNNDYEFVRTHEFASTCSTCDPAEWTNTTNSSTLLTNFRSWGQGGGFGNTAYDVAGLWTDRNFQNGVVGIAYVGGICNSFKYHCLQDYSSQDWAMRVMVSHELGHNFNSGHDGGSGFIMSPSVNNTSVWSTQSKNAINNFTNGLNCLSACIPQAPPVADFSANITEGCVPFTVNFSDQSTGGPTSWSWSFPGGTPSSSSQQNPTVTYQTKGEYNVTLTASNAAGSNSVTKFSFILAKDKPEALFDELVDENIVSFINLSTDGDTYYWEFGDGEFSNDENPIHVYPTDGNYQVVLTVTNECGIDVQTKWLEIVTTPEADFSSDFIEGCAPLTVQFQDLSTPNTTNWNWSFPGGVPSTSSLQNPVVTYQNPGMFSVTLTASNSAGSHTVVKANYIKVEPEPTAAFDFEVHGDSVFFEVIGTPDSVHWTFGDGNSSSNFNPVHVYATEGIYTVILTVFTECGSDEEQQEVTIVFPPEAGFMGSPIQGCAPLVVDFTQQASPNTTDFLWTFPGGNPSSSNEPDPTVTYDAPGNYTVTLIAMNAGGSDTLTLTDYVQVITIPQADFNATVNNGNEVTFENQSLYGSTYLWDFGDGNSSNEENPVHTYQAEGTFTVILTVTNACGTHLHTEEVTVVLPPEAGFSADHTTGCAPLTVQFSDQSSPSVTAWTWTFEGGTPFISNDQNPVVTYDTPGEYKVTLVVTNPIGMGELEIDDYIQVLANPVAGFDSENQNGTVQFTNTSQYGESYVWTFGDGGSSTQENPVHVYTEEGDFVVTLTVTNACGVNIVTQVVSVIFAPQAGFGSDRRSGCGESLTIQYYDQSEGQATSWSWAFEGGNPATSQDQNPQVTYTTPGLFDVMLVTTGPGGSDTLLWADYVLLETDVPVAKFTAQPEELKVTFDDQSERGASWLWSFGDGQTSTEQSPIHVYAAPGLYTVTLVVTNPCGGDTLTMEVTVQSSSVALPSFLTDLRIFPNPGTGHFAVVLEGRPVGDMDAVLYDPLGRRVHTERIPFHTANVRHDLHLEDLPQGIYLLRLSRGTEFTTRVVVIQR